MNSCTDNGLQVLRNPSMATLEITADDPNLEAALAIWDGIERDNLTFNVVPTLRSVRE